jgi:demethylmenaquinone methyltransferase/2-methoxy-6-polyprenyl-1,4-benzoquinol methylase
MAVSPAEWRMGMQPHSHTSSTVFFDSVAERWDSWEDLPRLHATLDAALERFELGPAEQVLDVGCGTGNLTAAILRRLSAQGRVTAVDCSGRMIAVARAKIDDARVLWRHAAVERLPVESACYERIFCYSVWPHLRQPDRIAARLLAMLKPGGILHVWHTISRARVNQIHARVSPAVKDHLLAPAAETATMLARTGFLIEHTQDDDEAYLVTACRPAAAAN